MWSRLSKLGLPVLITAAFAAAAVIWTLGYQARQEAYYTDFVYRRLGDTALVMSERLQATERTLKEQLKSGLMSQLEKAQDEATKRDTLKAVVDKVDGIKAAPRLPDDEDTPLYIWVQKRKPPDFFTTFDFLIGQSGEHIFDDILVSDNEGHVLYQQSWESQRLGEVGFLISRADTKTNQAPSPMDSFAGRSVSSFDKKYQVFRQDVRIDGEYSHSRYPNEPILPVKDLHLFGLVRNDRLRSEVLALPYTVGLLFTFVGLGVFFSIPLIRVALLRPLQRLKRWDGFWISASTFVTASLLTFALLNIAFFRLELDRRVRQNLSELADDVEKHATSDFQEIGKTLHDLTDGKCASEKCSSEIKTEGLAQAWWDAKSTDERVYMHLDTMSFVGADGKQTLKFAVAPYKTGVQTPPLVDVSDRDYFKAVKSGQTWTMGGATESSAGFAEPFYVQSVFSRTTGESAAVLAIPFEKKKGTNPAGKDGPIVALAQARPASLFGTFVPPGYGFAIIDPNSDPPGKVLFHHRDERNLREWMSDDLAADGWLNAVVFGRGEQFFSSSYLSRDHQFYARPFETFVGSPWILVTFSDQEYFRSALADVMRFALLMFGAYTLLLIAFAVYLAVRRATDEPAINPMLGIWPGRGKFQEYYGFIAAFTMGLAIGLACLIFLGHFPLILTTAAYLVPFGTFAVASRITRKSGRIENVFKRILGSWPSGRRYVLAATLCVLVMAVLPPAMLYRVAFDAKMRELSRHELLQLEKHLWDRQGEEQAAAAKLLNEGSRETFVEKTMGTMTDSPQTGYYKKGIYSKAELSSHGICNNSEGGSWRLLSAGLAGLYDQIGVETIGTEADSKDKTFRWCAPDAGREALEVRGLLADKPVVVTSGPLLSMGALLGPWALLCLLIPVGIGAWMSLLSRRVFHFDPILASGTGPGSSQQRMSSISGESPQHTLLLADGRAPESLPAACKLVDLAQKQPDEWSAELASAGPSCTVVLNHLEARIGDPSAVKRLAELIMERKDRVHFVLCSAVDPLVHLELDYEANCKENGSRDLTGSLSRALYGFAWRSASDSAAMRSQERGPWADLVERECAADIGLREIWVDDLKRRNGGTQEDVLEAIRLRADARYRELWNSCTMPERTILIQLAEEGVVNLRNRQVLGELIRKGLIVMHRQDECPRLLNRSFRLFVLANKPGVPLKQMESTATGGWDKLRNFVWPALLILGLYLLITQRKYFDNILPVVSGVAGEIAAFFKTFESFKRLWGASGGE